MRSGLRAALVVAVMAPAAAGGASAGAVPAAPLPEPSVRMSPDLLVVGALPDAAHVRFDAYSEDVASLQLLLAGIPLEPPLDVSGSGAEGSVTLPEDLPCGPRPLEAVWEPYGDDPEPRRTSSVVTIQCPALTLTPSVLLEADQPTRVDWDVRGLVPDSAVALRLDDEPVQVVPTDAAGSARFSAAVDGLSCGPHVATALDRSTPATRKQRGVRQEVEIVATAVLTVRCPAPVRATDPVPLPVPVPSVVRLNPVVVGAGTTTRVTGSSFTAGQTATLTWVLPDGSTQTAATVGVAADGGFVADVLVLVNSGQGPRELVASTPSGAAASDRALVVAGTTQPGRHGLVNRR